MKRGIFTLALFALVMTAGCQRSQPPVNSRGSSADRMVVVYSSADKEFAELIFRAYEQKTGVKVLPLYDTEETKPAGLTARLVAEEGPPPGRRLLVIGHQPSGRAG